MATRATKLELGSKIFKPVFGIYRYSEFRVFVGLKLY